MSFTPLAAVSTLTRPLFKSVGAEWSEDEQCAHLTYLMHFQASFEC